LLLIQGLDANYNQIQETVIPNGVSAVNTVNSYIRINGFGVIAAGSNMTNVGDITLQLVAGGSAQGIIRAGIGTSQQAVLTVPAGFIGVLTAAQFSMAGSPATKLRPGGAGRERVRADGGASLGALRHQLRIPYNEAVLIGFPNPPQTDITARLVSTGQAATEVSAGFQVILFRQNYLNAV